MSESHTTPTESHVDRIVATVAALPNVETAPHRVPGVAAGALSPRGGERGASRLASGVEFTLRGREIGHVHAGETLDVNYPRVTQDALIAADCTGPHHRFSGSGWTTLRVANESDVDRAVRLVTLSHLWHARALARRFGDVVVPPIERAPDAVRRLFRR
jgi:hypothetical protein